MQKDCGRADVIFHLAGGSSVAKANDNPLEDFHRTVGSTSEVLEYLRLATPQTRLVPVSSAAVYGNASKSLIHEETPPAPQSAYGEHKYIMETMCRFYAQRHQVLLAIPRLFSVYGSGLQKQILWDLCEKLAGRKTIELDGCGDETRDWIEIHDAVVALEKMSQIANSKAPVVNIANGKKISVKRLVATCVECWFGPHAKVPKISFTGRKRLGDPKNLVADVKKMKSLKIFPMVPLQKGVFNYTRWYKEIHSLK